MLGQISLVSLSHPKSCQGDRQIGQPSQHNGLDWNEAEISDPSADSWVVQLEQVSGQGKPLRSPPAPPGVPPPQ